MQVSIEPMYLTRQQAAQFVSLSEAMMERLVSRGEFPKPRMLSSKRVGWLVCEVRAWCLSRPISDLPPPQAPGSPKEGESLQSNMTSRLLE